MERQLQERLTGAAVLIIIAVILVPEMFSGPQSRVVDSADAINTAQVKTYQVQLEPHAITQAPAESAEPVEPIEVVARPDVAAQAQSSAVAQPSPVSESSASVSAQSVASSASIASVSSSSVSSVASKRSSAKSSAASSAKPAQVSTKKVPVDGKWAIQIGSFSTKARAQEVIAKLNSMGIKATATSITSGKKVLYRVRTTAMADRAAAATTLKKVESAFPGASVVSLN